MPEAHKLDTKYGDYNVWRTPRSIDSECLRATAGDKGNKDSTEAIACS